MTTTMWIIAYLVAWIVASFWCYEVMEEFAGKPDTIKGCGIRFLVALCFNFAWFLSMLVLFPVTVIAVMADKVEKADLKDGM